MKPDAVDRRDANRAAYHSLHLHEFAHQLLVHMKDFFGRLINAIALARQLKLLLASIDEKVVEVLFHRSSLLAYRGLRDSIEAGSLGKTFGFYEVGENLEIIDLHGVDGWSRKKYNSSLFRIN